MTVFSRTLLAATLLFLLAGTAAAQTNTGEISGVVKDSVGGVLPGAAVVARHPATNLSIERATDNQGRFFLPALQTGQWDVTVSLPPSFTTETRRGIALEIGRTLNLEFTLALAGVAQEIIVDAGVTQLQTETAEISDIIENRMVVEIPLNGRNLMALAQLSDSVVIPPGGTRGEALQQAGPLPNVGGQRSGHNIYLLDGAKVTDELFNNLVINPSIDSIQEFKIQKSMYPAEFGGKASALINVATKAGTNNFHGSLFEFYRNDLFDAPNAFTKNSPPPPLGQHQFGGALGGPLKKDKTFFFGSYEGLRMTRSLTRTFSVPDNAVRLGDFSAFADPIRDPLTGQPFSGNQIPVNRIDPIATGLLEEVPRATTGSTLVAAEESSRNIDQWSLRLDHRLSPQDQLFARFSTFDANEIQPYGTSSLQETLTPGFGRTLATRTRNFTGSHTHLFGTAMLNELRFGWMSVKGGQASVNSGNDFATRTGLLGVTTDLRDMGFPQISTRNQYSTMGDPTSFTYRDNEHFELYENFLIDRGEHKIKFGAYYFHLRLRPNQPDNARGSFTYTGQFSGNALADFLLGYPVSATSGIGRGDEDGRTNWWHLFVQDDWKILDNLTINAGLRYEHNQHMFDVSNRLSSIDLATPGGRFVIASDANGSISPTAASLLPLLPLPYVTSQEAGWDRGLLEPSNVRLAPRFGFSLNVNNAKTVIRGGYGIFLNQWAYSVQTAFARNLPFFYAKQVDVPVTQTIPTLRTRDILTSPATGTISPSIMDHDYHVEYSQTWSGGLQHELGSAGMVEVSYMGTWTIGADNATVRNVPEPGPGSIQARRPIPQLSRINAIRFDGKSIYHGVTFKWERRMRNHFAYDFSYTLSDSKDDASSPGPTESETNFPQNVRNLFGPGGEWANSSFDHRHQVVASGVLELPFFQNADGFRRTALSGWRLNSIVTAWSGAPFTVNLGVDQANIGAGPAQRPDQLRNPNLSAGRTRDRWFDTDAFAMPTLFTFGNAPRNSVLGPGFANVDLAVAKGWELNDSTKLEFRWETFNLFNRTNFDLPNRTFVTPPPSSSTSAPTTTNFGRIFSAKSPREMQFALRLSF